jgi:hypothetical protein
LFAIHKDIFLGVKPPTRFFDLPIGRKSVNVDFYGSENVSTDGGKSLIQAQQKFFRIFQAEHHGRFQF